MNSTPEAVYYESKIQYYIITLTFVVFFSYLTFFNPNNLRNIGQNFLIISLFAFIFVCFYQVSTFYIYEDRFIWKKGWKKIECPWSDLISINYDIQRNNLLSLNTSGIFFRSSSAFFIETKNGLTKYADKSNIKLKGNYSFLSKGDDLISMIKSKSKNENMEQTSSISTFKQTQKLWDWIFLISAIFVFPTIIILLYAIFTKDYSALNVFTDLLHIK
jgi:hypothetical protein